VSRTDLRRLLLIGAAALACRLGVAALTESRPLFPSFYYTDARLIDASAAKVYREAARGGPAGYEGTLSQRVQVRVQYEVYRLFGVHPFAMKAVNAVLGSLAVVVLGAALWEPFGPGPALTAAAFVALWPSAVFYTSQNFKEAPALLFAYLSLALLTPLAEREARPARRSAVFAALGGVALLMVGLYRSYVMLVTAAAVGAACLWRAALERRVNRGVAAGLAVALIAPAAFLPVSRLLTTRWLSAPMSGDPRNLPQILPVTYDGRTAHAYRPFSPQGISEFRRIRQRSDEQWAEAHTNRKIGTQIFPDARFRTWLDVAAYLPKGAFYVLFMPLPGLYPLNGKIGRLLAALENLGLLALAALGLAGAARGPKTPARAAFLLFFLMMTVGSALLEFDLGSAGRHKLLYLPMLFPFAVEEIRRLAGRGRPA
jgi:hypothetical protein